MRGGQRRALAIEADLPKLLLFNIALIRSVIDKFVFEVDARNLSEPRILPALAAFQAPPGHRGGWRWL